jgi:hypothetical protein
MLGDGGSDSCKAVVSASVVLTIESKRNILTAECTSNDGNLAFKNTRRSGRHFEEGVIVT